MRFSVPRGVIELSVSIREEDRTDSCKKCHSQENQLEKGLSEITLPFIPEKPQHFLRLSVKNYGKGIQTGLFENIFEPFAQGTSQLDDLYGGTGLGLAITFKLVEALNGTIHVSSVENEWTEFVVEIPFADPLVEKAATVDALRNAHIFVIDRHPALNKRIFEGYDVNVTFCNDMKEIHDPVNNSMPISDLILLVRENLFDENIYTCLSNKYPCALLTFGPRYSVKSSQMHFRDLSRIIPSVLVGHKIVSCLSSKKHRYDRIHPQVNPNEHRRIGTLNGDLRVLVAEDNKVNQKVLLRMLQRLGIENIFVVGDGKDAVKEEEKNVFDLILMDEDMPVMGGCEATSFIIQRHRSAGSSKTPKIVFVSASVSPEFEERCMKVGGSALLTKPYSLSDLSCCLQRLFSLDTKPVLSNCDYAKNCSMSCQA
jgi:CheY-like chemotaxis protein